MASPTMLTRLVLLVSLFLLGVFAAVEHAAPDDPKTPSKRQGQYPNVFVRDDNLWVAHSSNNEKQLSTTGTPENPFDGSRIFLSPNKNFAVAWQYTPDEDHKITLIASSPTDRVEPRYSPIPYLKPGDRVRVDRPRMFQLMGNVQGEIPTNDTLFQNPLGIEHIGWSPNNEVYRFLYNERGHQHKRVIAMGADGTVRAIVDESSETFINDHKHYCKVLENTKELIWASERDGWNHLYLYDLVNGTVKNQITKGNWLVRNVEHVDPATRRIWVNAFGLIPAQDPYYAHLLRVSFSGTNSKILTWGGNNGTSLADPGDGNHSWQFNIGQDTQFTDTWSRVDQPETEVIRNAETGDIISVRRTPGANPLASIVEMFSAPGRDGTTKIYGLIVKPSNFNPAKKYPIIEDIYAGPQDFSTPKSYSDLGVFRPWAEKGYVVVKIDGMGTNWRSKAFHDVCWKNLKDAGFPDRIAWMKAAASTRPWMDLSRVGILGGSAGGQNAVGALLFHGDFYKAAAADSGCHDNRMDKRWWNEQWMGYPLDQSYEDSSNVVHAGKLQGKLYLSVPMLDDNVDPSSTYQLVHALNKADKDYEFVLLPMGEHSSGFGDYGLRRMQAFFKKNLLEA